MSKKSGFAHPRKKSALFFSGDFRALFSNPSKVKNFFFFLKFVKNCKNLSPKFVKKWQKFAPPNFAKNDEILKATSSENFARGQNKKVENEMSCHIPTRAFSRNFSKKNFRKNQKNVTLLQDQVPGSGSELQQILENL